MDKIYVNGMSFYGYHGVFPEETKLGQKFRADVVASMDLRKAGISDNLEESVSYAEIFEVAKQVVEGKPYKLIEAVAEEMASRILARFPLIQEVTVKISKPNPPIPGHYHSVAVEITRSR